MGATMKSYLAPGRPPIFCPGCGHERVVYGLDTALQHLGMPPEKLAIVTDIGCSGLFDTFFATHALHGLHGRVLTYASGLKMADPELTVIAVMGDGGLGIGGAHVLSSCRRNLDFTLLVLNNFNYGMTGGQCSATSPQTAGTASHFLNELEKPLDLCRVAAAAGAPYTERISALDGELAERLAQAISFNGFALLDIWSICPGRYSRRNRITPKLIEEQIARLGGSRTGVVAENLREEYGSHYRRQAAQAPVPPAPMEVAARFSAPGEPGRREILLLGSAGQYVTTAGEVLALAAMSAGLRASLKSDYPITVLRGHSIAEVVVDQQPVEYTGIAIPGVVLCLAQEGIDRRRQLLAGLPPTSLVVADRSLDVPPSGAQIVSLDFHGEGFRQAERFLAALAYLAANNVVIGPEMFTYAVAVRYGGGTLDKAQVTVDKALRLFSG